MAIILRRRSTQSLTKEERDDLSRLVPWTLDPSPAPADREGLEGLRLTILLPEGAGKKSEDLTRWIGRLCAEFAWSPTEVTLDGPLDGLLLRLLAHRARETNNALGYWYALISAHENSEPLSQDVLDYLLGCARRLFNGGRFDPDAVARALLLKPVGTFGPNDMGRRTLREDAETLLALLLALRLVDGTKMFAARKEVARFAKTSEATVTRAWRKARPRGERVLGALLALTEGGFIEGEFPEGPRELFSHRELQLMIFGWIVRSLGGIPDAESPRDSDS